MGFPYYKKIILRGKNMEDTEKILKKIAIAISDIDVCGNGGCPCKKNCEVYGDNECIERIMNWLRYVVS